MTPKTQVLEYLDENSCELDENSVTSIGGIYRRKYTSKFSFIPNREEYNDLSLVQIYKNLGISIPDYLEDMSEVHNAFNNHIESQQSASHEKDKQ